MLSLNLLLFLYAVCMCVQQEVTIKPIYVSLDHLIRVFSLMDNMMILMLMRVHGNFVQQMVTKFNDCDFSKCKYVQGISVHFLLSFSLKSRTCIYFCYFKSCWCMYAYLYLSKHNKDLKKQNFIPLMHLVLFNNPL